VAIIVQEHSSGAVVAVADLFGNARLRPALAWMIQMKSDATSTPRRHPVFREARLALAFGGVGLIGFCVDAALLHLGLEAGLPAWGARAISLFFAMQATFTINGLHVFRDLDRTRLVRQWSGYMLANGFGNFCNYWIFLTMVSTHWPLVSNHYFALATGSLFAWLINFAGTRLFVFRGPRNTLSRRSAPDPDGPSPCHEPDAP
jgi:putative flippase GtrA